MRPLKVLFAYPQPLFGLPPWTVLALIINHLDRDRFAPVVLAAEHTDGDPALAADRGIPVHRFPLRTARDVAASLPAMRRMALLERIDVVHANEDGRSAFVSTLLASLIRRPLVLHYHATPRIYRGARLALLRATATMAARNVGVSEFIAREL